MNQETLLRVKQADPWPEDRPTPEGVWHASQALDEIVGRTTQKQGEPTDPIGSGPVVAVVAAVIVLVLIGGFALLINNSGETQPAVTVVTTLREITPTTAAESAPTTVAPVSSTETTVAAEPVTPPGEGPQLGFVPAELPSGEWLSDGVWFQGAVYATSVSGGGLFRSSDGLTWELLPSPLPPPPDIVELYAFSQGLVTEGGLLVARAEESNGSGCALPGDAILVHTSNNGVDWKRSRVELPIPDPPAIIAERIPGHTSGACYSGTGGAGFVVGPAGIMISGGVIDDHNPEGFPATGYAFFSPDGQTWTQLDATGPLDGGQIADLVATSEGFVATSESYESPYAQTFLWETTDGTTWIQKSDLSDSHLFNRSGLGVWDGRLVAATRDGVWTIEDTPQELIASDGMPGRGIQIGEFGLVGVAAEQDGGGTEVLFSANGATWNRWTPPEFGPEFGTVYVVGIGDDFVVLQLVVWDEETETSDLSLWVGSLP